MPLTELGSSLDEPIVLGQGAVRIPTTEREGRKPHPVLEGARIGDEPALVRDASSGEVALVQSHEAERVPDDRVTRVAPERFLQPRRRQLDFSPARRPEAPGPGPASVPWGYFGRTVVHGKSLFVAMYQFQRVAELDPRQRAPRGQVARELLRRPLRGAEVPGGRVEPHEEPALRDGPWMGGDVRFEPSDRLAVLPLLREEDRVFYRRVGRATARAGDPREDRREHQGLTRAGRRAKGHAQMAEYKSILVSEQDGIAKITVNRPDKLNALNRAVIDELTDAIRAVSRSSGPRVAILTGAGDKAFVAGADIAEMSTLSTSEAKLFSDAGHGLCALIETAPCPFIAQVSGFALGGGCELALACDFIYASDKARFGQPEVNLGLMPGFGGTQRLAYRVGPGRARELIYTGEMINAEQALAWGLANQVFPLGDLEAKVLAVAQKIASRAPLGVSSSKRAILRGALAGTASGCELEATAFAALFGSADQKEGTKAFLEKRPPGFQGR